MSRSAASTTTGSARTTRCSGRSVRARADYLPLFENLVPLLGADAPDFSFPILRTAFDRFLFGRTFNEMSQSHGLRVTVDNVHLNERGAGVAHRLAAQWLEAN